MKATVMQRVLLVSSAILVLLITIYVSLDFELPAEIGGILVRLLKGDWYTRALKVTLVARGYFPTSANSMTTTVVPLLKQVYKQLSDGIINLLFFQCHVNLHKKTPYQGGDQMRKKRKKNKLRTVEPYHKRKSRRGHNKSNNKSFIYSAG